MSTGSERNPVTKLFCTAHGGGIEQGLINKALCMALEEEEEEEEEGLYLRGACSAPSSHGPGLE